MHEVADERAVVGEPARPVADVDGDKVEGVDEHVIDRQDNVGYERVRHERQDGAQYKHGQCLDHREPQQQPEPPFGHTNRESGYHKVQKQTCKRVQRHAADGAQLVRPLG